MTFRKLKIVCPTCGYCDEDVRGYVLWQCPKCKNKLNLSQFKKQLKQHIRRCVEKDG